MKSGDPLLLGQVVRQSAAGSSRRSPARSLLRILLVLVVAAAAWSWLHALRLEVEAGDFARIRTDVSRLDTGPGWVDPRWREELRFALAELDDVHPDDRQSIRELCGHVASLPFVSEVGEPTVLWPDGLRLELRLREPIACVHLGRIFLGVAADGTVLPGTWPTPPARDASFLPVIELPPDVGGPSGIRVAPGSILDAPAAVDGLAVAATMWRLLTHPDLTRLGRCVIDARLARVATVEEPGTRLRLEGRRTVWLGRSPNLDAPGELPVERKWAHVSRALALLEPDLAREDSPQGLDWDLLDARWDRADLHERAAPDEPDEPDAAGGKSGG